MPMKYPPHPGRSVLRDCMEPLGMSIAETAQKMGMSVEQLTRVIDGQEGISPAMATALDKLFGGGASTWYQLQKQFDEAQERSENEVPGGPDPLVVHQQTATRPLEHGQVVYKTFDAEVISLRIVPSVNPELSDDRNHSRVEFQFVGEGPGAVQIQLNYQPQADSAPSLIADVLFKTYLVWDAASEEYMGRIDASEWNRESQKLHEGIAEMNALHALLVKQGPSSALNREIPVEPTQEFYSDVLKEAEDLLYKGTDSVPATALAAV